MKKLYFSIVLLLASISTFVAQQKPSAARECGSDRVHLENLKSTSDYKMNFDKQNIDYQTWVLKQLKGKFKTLDTQVYTPPSYHPSLELTQFMQGTYIVRLINNGVILGQTKLIKK